MDKNSWSFSIITEYGVHYILSAYTTFSNFSFIQKYLKLKISISIKILLTHVNFSNEISLSRMRYFKYEMTTWFHWFLTWILNDFSTKILLEISSISQFYLGIFSTMNFKIIWESRLKSHWIHNDISPSFQSHCFQGVEILNWDNIRFESRLPSYKTLVN